MSTTGDEIRVERKPRETNTELMASGKASPDQLTINDAVWQLEKALALVPTTTMHYAVEDFRRAIRSYRNAPSIKTKDA